MELIFKRAAALVLAAALVTFFGCTSEKAYHPVTPNNSQSNAVTMQVENHGWSVFSGDRALSDAERNIYRPVTFDRFWVEYSDSGEPHETEGTSLQTERLLTHIKNISSQPNTKIYVSVFIHGWNQSADNSTSADNNGASDSDAVRFDYFLARQAEQLRRLHEQRGELDFPRVVGVFVGWRGNTTTIPILLRTTLGNRSAAADRIAQNRSDNSLHTFISKLSTRLLEADEHNRMLITGHSLGGRMIARMVTPELEEGEAHPFGDHVMLLALQPAVGADCFNQFKRRQEKSVGSNNPPSLWMITSEDDIALNWFYPWSARINIDQCGEGYEGHTTAIGMYEDFNTHELTFDGFDHIRIPNDNTALAQYLSTGFPDAGSRPWVQNGSERQRLRYYMRALECDIDASASPPHCYDILDAFRVNLKFESIPTSLDASLIWNIKTDGNIINHGGSRVSSVDGLHNGYVSTNLSRLIIEWLYRD